ncbi:MAG: bacteriohemerythrin, partial [Candidatus Thiodiazotropha taylori]
MALMQWIDDKYSTKVDVCDTQHKELFNRVNALNDAVSTGARQEIGTTLDNLIDYVVVHFETEERLMEERGYKGLDAHKEEHKQLVQTCADL